MDTGFVTREQDRLLGELFTLPAHPEREHPARPTPADCRRAADWLMDRVQAAQVRQGRPARGEGASDRLGREPARPRQARRCWSTGTTTSSRPIPSTSGSPRRSSRPSATASSYARGAVDDKGQVFCLLKAYEAVLDADGRPPLNVNFIIEGEEECGGDVIVRPPRRASRSAPSADAVLVADMSYYAPGHPGGLHRAPRHVLRRDPPPDAGAGPPLRHLRRRGAQRARGAGAGC